MVKSEQNCLKVEATFTISTYTTTFTTGTPVATFITVPTVNILIL